MPIRRIPFLLLLILGAGFLMTGCESKPTAPVMDNRFDPHGPQATHPFDLTAYYSNGTITLTWRQTPEFGIVNYDVQHSTTYSGEFFSIGTVEASANETAFFIWEDVPPTSDHFFKIQAFDAGGNYTNTDIVTPVSLSTPAVVVVGDDNDRHVASRNVVLNIFVTEGDSLRISQDGAPGRETVVAAAPAGAAKSVAWDLGEAPANDTVMHVNVVVQNGTSLGDTNKVNLTVDFTPTLALAGGGTRIASRQPTFQIPSDGMVSMRLADSEENLAAQDWITPQPSYNLYQLADTTAPQTIYAEFLSDFGFSVLDDLTVTADLLEDAAFHLDLPADHITSQRTVQAINSAVATQMRFSESLDFHGVDWEAYQETAPITLSADAGQKVIYGQFRNDFSQSGILTDFAIYLSQPVAIAFTAPAAGDTLTGGGTLQIMGTTTAPSGSAPVDSVKIDTGDGWTDAVGIATWSHSWTSPVVTEITDVSLRARAWAAQDSATAVLNLVLKPE
ncbi:hypothetical protein CSB20_14310 [bacterium DOLZORAL124_64_63]|nr:MAG: hypothetical protein CSB20_14310 [bacterium DOLZORAL124_64_63]